MTLTSALRSATSSLASQSQHVANLSRNISGVGDPTYVRRDTQVYTDWLGATRVETSRYVNEAVYSSMITSNAEAEMADVVARGVNHIAALQDSANFAFSPANLLGELQRSVEFAAAAPSDGSGLASLVEQARSVSSAIRASYEEILTSKERADKAITESVSNINSLLSQIEEVNRIVVETTRSGSTDFNAMDIRDQLVSELSGEIGIRIIGNDFNDIIITTTSGAMMFEEHPRDVSFVPTPSFGHSTAGNELRIDGISVTGPNAVLKVESGKIAGHFQLRDEFLDKQQLQMDEIARGLIETFAEKDQTGGTKPPLAGLFTWSGGPAVPTSGVLERGIASTITLNPLVDPQNGGDPTLIRDGALNGDADYLYNLDGASGYSERLFALAGEFDTQVTFDTVAGLPTQGSLNAYAANALDYLNAGRANALNTRDYKSDLSTQLRTALQNETGVNLDDEMSRLLEVERTYQASSRLIQAVDDMLLDLLGATQ